MPPPGTPEVRGVTAVRVRVPATSANLGPGFDAMALALSLYDEVVVATGGDVPAGDDALSVDVTGEAADGVPRDEGNLLVRAVRRGLAALGEDDRRPLAVSATLSVPHARGLGSSAAAIVAGLLAARALVPDGPDRLPDEDLLVLADAMEGHPDNVAACLYGGVTLAWADLPGGAGLPSGPEGASAGGDRPRVHALRKEPAADLTATVLVPPERASTAEARGLLPASVPHADAARNAARAALLLEALTHRPDLLPDATEDALHQRYRATAMPGSLALVDELRAHGRAAVLSGAGPSVLVLSSGNGGEVAAPAGWRTLSLPVDREGARVVPAPVGVTPPPAAT
jgi:homoserine kinase